MSIQESITNVGINALITTIISTAIALFANRYFVEKKQMKIQHSKDMVDKIIRNLSMTIDNICIEGFEYNPKEDRFTPKELLSYDTIPHYEYLEQHFTSGYPEEWHIWKTFEEQTGAYNHHLALIIEGLRQGLFQRIPLLKKE